MTIVTIVYVILLYPWHEAEERYADNFREEGVIEAEDIISLTGDIPLSHNDVIQHVHPSAYHGKDGKLIDPPKPDAPEGDYWVTERVCRIDNTSIPHVTWKVKARWAGPTDDLA